jgi:hypothetical protein
VKISAVLTNNRSQLSLELTIIFLKPFNSYVFPKVLVPRIL